MSELFSMEEDTVCRHCGASLKGAAKPNGGFYSRCIGVEVPGVYDGVLFWQCPDCGHRWNRWPANHYLHTFAERYIKGKGK